VLIIMVWKDAKWGTIANFLILIVTLLSFTTWRFEQRFKGDVKRLLQHGAKLLSDFITQNDHQERID